MVSYVLLLKTAPNSIIFCPWLNERFKLKTKSEIGIYSNYLITMHLCSEPLLVHTSL